VKTEKYAGALLFAHHHPPYTLGGVHSSSLQMRQQMDQICKQVGVWPHAVLAGHAHNYQRYTRLRSDGTEIPYIVCGNGGHGLQKLASADSGTVRAPQTLQQATATDDAVTFENYDDTDYGYLRVIADPTQLRIEYHPASDGAVSKAPDDSVTIDLATRKRTVYAANDLGLPASTQAVRATYAAQAKKTAQTAKKKTSEKKKR